MKLPFAGATLWCFERMVSPFHFASRGPYHESARRLRGLAVTADCFPLIMALTQRCRTRGGARLPANRPQDDYGTEPQSEN